MFYVTSYKRRVLPGVAAWGCGREVFVEVFLHVPGKLVLKWWVRYPECTYIDSVSTFSNMGT